MLYSESDGCGPDSDSGLVSEGCEPDSAIRSVYRKAWCIRGKQVKSRCVKKGLSPMNLESCSPCEVNVKNDVEWGLQMRLLRAVLKVLEDAQAFMQAFCGQDEQGGLWFQRWALKVNNAAIPLVRLVAVLTENSKLAKV